MSKDWHSILSNDADFILWTLIRQTEWLIFRVREAELAPYGLTPEQAAVCLFSCLADGHPTPSELAKWLVREPHTVSGILDRMQKKGLLRKVSDVNRKNMIRVVLTEKGRWAFEQATKRETIHQIFSCLDDEEHEQLKSILIKLRDSVIDQYGMFKKPPFPVLK